MSFPLNPAAARSGAPHRRPAAGAGRRGQRQDARHHRQDRAPDRAGRRPARIVAITFTNKAAREMRERAQALLKAQGKARRGREGRRSRRSTRWASRSCAAKRRRWDLKPGFSIFDPADLESDRRRARRDGRSRPRARRRSGRSARGRTRWSRRPTALTAAQDDDERRRGARLRALRRGAGRLPGGRLRRPDRARRSRCSSATPTRARAGRRAARTCWSTNTRTPTRRSTGCCARWSATRTPFTAVGDDDQAIYGWRGATLDNLAQLPRDYPGPQGRQARAELPLDGAHPALAPTR